MDVCASLPRQEGGDRLGDEKQETITDRRLSFGRNGIQNRDDKAARIQQTVAHGVPQRRPDDGSRDSRIDGAHVGQRDIGRSLVEARDRVGEVIVVNDDQVGGCGAAGHRHNTLGINGGAVSVDTDVEHVRPFERPGSDAPRRNGHAVGTQHTVAGLAALVEREVRDRADAIGDPRSGQRRRTGGLQPRAIPGRKLLL